MPRRLIFTYFQDTPKKSNQQYFIDCTWYQIKKQLLTEEELVDALAKRKMSVLKVSSKKRYNDIIRNLKPSTICDWRELASRFSGKLILVKRNGTTELDFVYKQSKSNNDSSLPVVVSTDATVSTTTDIVFRKIEDAEKQKDLIVSLGIGRFQKHTLSRVSAHVQRIQQSQVIQVNKVSSYEWHNMMLEDLRSTEFRGLLVLDTKSLNFIRRAYVVGSRKAKSAMANWEAGSREPLLSPSESHSNEELQMDPIAIQLTEIAKELKVILTPIELNSALIRPSRPWWKKQTKHDLEDEENLEQELWDYACFAEWYRACGRKLPPSSIATAAIQSVIGGASDLRNSYTSKQGSVKITPSSSSSSPTS
jgi:hypothetical protein